MEDVHIPLVFYGEEDFIKFISEYVNRYGKNIEIKENSMISECLDLDLTDFASIVTIVTGITSLIGFSKCIFDYLKENKEKKIILKTPFKVIEIHSKDAWSEEQVNKILSKIVEVDKDD